MHAIYRITLILLLVFGADAMTYAQERQPLKKESATRATIAVPPAGYKCVKGSPSYCKCEGIKDCLALDDSGKCTGPIQDNGDSGTCSSEGADKPATPNKDTVAARPARAASSSSAQATRLAAPPQRYGCEYDPETHQKIGCVCDSISDCLDLKKSGECGDNPIEETEPGIGQC